MTMSTKKKVKPKDSDRDFFYYNDSKDENEAVQAVAKNNRDFLEDAGLFNPFDNFN